MRNKLAQTNQYLYGYYNISLLQLLLWHSMRNIHTYWQYLDPWHLYPNEQGLGAVSKYTEVHPSIALSDTAPLESKLTNKQVNVIRQQRGIREGQHKNTPVHLDLLARKI